MILDSFAIIYSDDDLMVINKPAGLVSSPSETQSEPTLADLLSVQHHIKLERGGLVHRLDKDTSGLMVVAKTQETLENLQLQFQTRTVKKQYTALVHGLTPEQGSVIAPIGRNPQNREKFTVRPDGKLAQTDYQTISRYLMSEKTLIKIYPDFSKIQIKKLNTQNYNQFSLLQCFPLTGRTHQIRVHLKHINHPLVGDERYAGRKTARLDHRWCARQFLHAAMLQFIHPKTKQTMTFEASLPTDLKLVLLNLEPIDE